LFKELGYYFAAKNLATGFDQLLKIRLNMSPLEPGLPNVPIL
jgi:hypothetical protein